MNGLELPPLLLDNIFSNDKGMLHGNSATPDNKEPAGYYSRFLPAKQELTGYCAK